MALESSDIQLILSMVSQMLQEHRLPVAEDGVAVAGSWAPSDDASIQKEAATVQVTVGKTYAITGDDGDTGFAKFNVPVATTHVGDQYGPVGGERVVLLQTESGPVALFIHGPDDSPAAPAGERWITHRNSAGAVIAYTKWTNDGANAGDGLGGIKELVGAYYQAKTAGGIGVQIDDANSETLLGNLATIVAGNPNKVVRYKDIAILITALNQHYHAANNAASGQPIGPTTSSGVYFTNPGASGTVKASD